MEKRKKQTEERERVWGKSYTCMQVYQERRGMHNSFQVLSIGMTITIIIFSTTVGPGSKIWLFCLFWPRWFYLELHHDRNVTKNNLVNAMQISSRQRRLLTLMENARWGNQPPC